MSEVPTSIQEVELVCGFLSHTADNPFWDQSVDRDEGELWQYAFARLIHQDKMAVMGLMPDGIDEVSVNSKKWYSDRDNLIVMLSRSGEDRYLLSIDDDYTREAKLMFGEDGIILKLSRDLVDDPVGRQHHLILGMLAIRRELEEIKSNG